AEDGIRDWSVTGVQTCALPIFSERTLMSCPPGEKRFGSPHMAGTSTRRPSSARSTQCLSVGAMLYRGRESVAMSGAKAMPGDRADRKSGGEGERGEGRGEGVE